MTVNWSYTFLSDYENCPWKAYSRHVARSVPFVKTPQQAWGIEAHKALEKRLTSGQPLPETLADIEPICAAMLQIGGKLYGEQALAVRQDWTPTGFYEPDAWGKCKVDVTIVVGDAAVFADWKTGKRREDPWELEIQAMMLRKKHPEIARCTGYYVWLKDVELGDPHQLNKDNSVQARIQGMMNHVARAEQLNHWPKRENPLCGWCDVKTCEFNRSGK